MHPSHASSYTKAHMADPHTQPLHLDTVVSQLEHHLNRLKLLQARVQTSSQHASASTSRRRKTTHDIPPDVRAELENAARSIIAEVQIVLQSLSPPLQGPQAADPSPIAISNPVIKAQIASDHTAQAPNSKRKAKRKPTKLRSQLEPPNKTDEEDDDESDEDLEDELSEDSDQEVEDEEDDPEEDQDGEQEGDQDGNPEQDQDGNPEQDQDENGEEDQDENGEEDQDGNREENQEGEVEILRADEPDIHPIHAVSTATDGTCDQSGLGLYTVPTLERFAYEDHVQRTGMCHLLVSDFSLKNLDSDLSHVPGTNHTTAPFRCNTATFSQPGIVIVSSNQPTPPDVSRPAFTDTPRVESSHDDIEGIFETYCTPKVRAGLPHWYLVGPIIEVLGERHRDLDLLSPGPYMQQLLHTTIEGISTTYIYASYSQGQTATAMHIEDCHWGSVNLVLCGPPNLWLSVEPTSNNKLEAGLRTLFPGMKECSQSGRYLSILIAPSLLEKLGVKYHIKACHSGELIFTTRATYHQIINMGPNMAALINFMDSKTPAFPEDYVFCTKSKCGVLHSMNKTHFRPTKHYSPELAPESPPKRKSRTVTTLDLVQAQGYSLGLGDYLLPGLVRKSPPALLVSIISHQAVTRLVQLLLAQSLDCNTFGISAVGVSSSTPTLVCQAASYRCATRTSLRFAKLSLLRERANKYAYVDLLEKRRGEAGKLDSELVIEILREQGIVSTYDTRQAFIHDCSTSRKWLSLCSILRPGLLALLPLQSTPPYHLDKTTLTEMTEANITEFNELVRDLMKDLKNKKTLEHLCAIADGLVKRIIRGTHFQFDLAKTGNNEAHFEYQCERVDGAICQIPEEGDFDLEDSLESLALRPYLMQSKPAKTSAVNPIMITETGTACSQEVERCMCVQSLRLNLYRILPSTMDRERSVLSRAAFRDGEFIGELTGLLHDMGHNDCSGTFFNLY
jgi:hypothetical protein